MSVAGPGRDSVEAREDRRCAYARGSLSLRSQQGVSLMKKHLLHNVTSFSFASLCVIATFAAGCADAEEKPPVQTQKAAITSRGITANGCAGTALFDITNNSESLNKAINEIVVDNSAISNVKSKLFSLNSQNQMTEVKQESSQVSKDMASALSKLTNETNAHQRTLAEQSANASHKSNATTTSTVSHSDSADTFNKSKSDVFSERSGSQRRSTDTESRAFADQRSRNRADSSRSASNFADSVNTISSFQELASFISNDSLGGFDAFGLAGFNAANISDVASNSAFASRRAASNNSASADNSIANLARSASLTSASTSTEQASDFFNSARASNEQERRTSVANASTTTTTQSVADAEDTSTKARQENSADQRSASKQENATSSSNLFSQAQSFKSLNEISSENFVLELSFTANSEKAFTSLFAFNKDNNVLTSNNFNFSFPGCVGD
jgi:trimeric autotransporter adhesin